MLSLHERDGLRAAARRIARVALRGALRFDRTGLTLDDALVRWRAAANRGAPRALEPTAAICRRSSPGKHR